jgi:hypothetical protein
VQARVTSLVWDIGGVGDDLFVARVDLGEQRRRVHQAVADLSAAADCRSASQIASDARHAADGVVAVRNDVGRAQVSLSYVSRDLRSIARDLGRTPRGTRDADRLARALALGQGAVSRANSTIAASLAEATDLRRRVDTLQLRAKASC